MDKVKKPSKRNQADRELERALYIYEIRHLQRNEKLARVARRLERKRGKPGYIQ